MTDERQSRVFWRSIAESVIEQPPVRLSYRAARESPCQDCRNAPCCTVLSLQHFRVETLMDIDRAMLALFHENIEVGLAPDFELGIFLRRPCRHLDTATGRCTIYHRPERPRVCAHYSPFGCWYRPIYTTSVHKDYLRLDLRRMELFASRLGFDVHRNIVALPRWPELVQAMAAADDQAPMEAPPPQAPAGAPEVAPEEPCRSCAAHCCKVLVFLREAPRTAKDLDELRYAMGFPGVTLGIDDGGNWHLVVSTTCRHLQGTRCGLHGKPERPFFCQFYDARACTFRGWFAGERPGHLFQVGLERLDALYAALPLSSDGEILGIPPPGTLRSQVEHGGLIRARQLLPGNRKEHQNSRGDNMNLTLNAEDLAELSALQKDAILQALLLSLGIDRVADAEEVTRFNEEVARIPWGIEERVLQDMVQAARVRRKLVSKSEDARAWIQEIASRLPSQSVKEKTLAAMARIATVNGVNVAERGLLNAVAAAFELPAERLELLKQEILAQRPQGA